MTETTSRLFEAADDLAERDRRIAAARSLMERHGFDALVVSDFPEAPQPAYARYLSGFNLSPAIGAVNHVVVIPRAGEPTLAVPPGQKRSFAHLAHARSWLDNVSTTYIDDPEWELKTRWGHLATDLSDAVVEALRSTGVDSGRIGLAGTFAGLDNVRTRLPNATFEPTIRPADDGPEDLLVELIWTTSSWEAGRLELAQRAADEATRAYVRVARAGGSPREAYVEAEVAAKREGVDDLTLYGSAGVGPWAFWDLAHPASGSFAPDHVYFIEVAMAGWSGFGVQSGRSFVLAEPTAPQKNLIETSQRALAALLAAIRPGVTGGELWDVGIEVARAGGLESWAQLGHHKGLLPGGSPRRIAFMPGNATPLDAGQTVVVHPGFFDAATGEAAFLGDTVLITDDGYQSFADSPLGYGLEDL